MPLTEPTFPLSISHQLILLALVKTDRIRGHSSINTQRTVIIFITLPAVNYLLPRGETLFHLPPIDILEIFKDFSSTTRKYSKTFSPANLSEPQITNNPKIFKEFFRLQICLSRKSPLSRKYSKTFQQSTAAISSSNQQQQPAAAISNSNQQQQSATATSSSNQQQQSATATSSSNQQQQSTAATSSSNQQQQPAATTSSGNQHSSYQQHLHHQRRPPLVNTTVPSKRYPASSWPRTSCPVAECNHRTEAHFCYFSTFLKFLFCDFFPFLPRPSFNYSLVKVKYLIFTTYWQSLWRMPWSQIKENKNYCWCPVGPDC